MLRIAIFASGNGTNAENIINYFTKSSIARVVLVLSNNKDAKVLERAERLHVNHLYFNRKDLYTTDILLQLLVKKADFIVLAGFLWKIPKSIIQVFPKKIVNIHPALLPKYGGKGMYGEFVHQEVKRNKELETGITIHYVDENYDEGAVVFQKNIALQLSDSIADIAQKVHQLEYRYYPEVIEKILLNDNVNFVFKKK